MEHTPTTWSTQQYVPQHTQHPTAADHDAAFVAIAAPGGTSFSVCWSEEDRSCSEFPAAKSTSAGGSQLTKTLQEEWDECEEIFCYRDNVLLRILSGSEKHRQPHDSSGISAYLLQRELEVRTLERLCFLLERGWHGPEAMATTSTTRDSKIAGVPSSIKARSSLMNPTAVYFDLGEDGVFFDCVSNNELVPSPANEENHAAENSIVPRWLWSDWKLSSVAFINLFLYGYLYICIDEVIQQLIEMAFPWREHKEKDKTGLEFVFLSSELLLSYIILRYTVTLYWFASPSVYDTVKFDAHNGLKLGNSRARIMALLRKNVMISTLVFMVGYKLLCNAVLSFNTILLQCLFGPDDPDYSDPGDSDNNDWIFSSTFLFDLCLLALTLTVLVKRGFLF